MKILVTGANGYLGQGIVRCLCDKGEDVIATDFSSENIDTRATIMTGNIFELEEPYGYFNHPDVVLHLAWRDGFKHDSLNHINDLPYHFSFLQKMMAGGISKLAVLGSVHEVGFFEGCVNENTPTNPQSLYGICKNSLRQMCELETKRLGIILQWFRGYYIVGNTEYGCSVFSKITQAEKEKKEFFPFTSGMNQFDFIDYDVFCEQIATSIMQDEVNGIINCCSGFPERIGERVERFIEENGYHIKLNYGTFPDRPYDSKAIWGDDKKIKVIMERDKKL